MNYKKLRKLLTQLYKESDDSKATGIYIKIEEMMNVEADKPVIKRLIDEIESDTGHKLDELVKKGRYLKLMKLLKLDID
ncbi:MAG: hypothetical protein PHP53_21100 [Prolixibacteraceae bacterium]|jgi:hypothetical protein|nr:hypothetical protein [Prolixibacteraceae bacterium]